MRYWLAVAVIVCSACSACGGKSTTDPTYADLSGRYSGDVSGVSQGQVISAVFSLVMTQAKGSTSGTSEMNGYIGSGSAAPAFGSPGTVKGTVGSGIDPAVAFTITSNACPAHTTQFSGTYNTANKKLILNGTLELYSATSCAVTYSFPSTLLLVK